MALLQQENHNSYRAAQETQLQNSFESLGFGEICSAIKDTFMLSVTSLPNIADLMPQVFESLGMDAAQNAVQASLRDAMQAEPAAAREQPHIGLGFGLNDGSVPNIAAAFSAEQSARRYASLPPNMALDSQQPEVSAAPAAMAAASGAGISAMATSMANAA